MYNYLLFCTLCSSDLFYPSQYIPLLASAILLVLDRLQKRLADGLDASVEFLGLLVGKLAISGYGGKE